MSIFSHSVKAQTVEEKKAEADRLQKQALDLYNQLGKKIHYPTMDNSTLAKYQEMAQLL